MTNTAVDLSQIVADAREDVQLLRRTGNVGQAEYLTTLLDRINGSAEDYLRWLSEDKAHIKSGLSFRTLRRRFPELLECDLARYNAKREREYRACAVPQRADVTVARAQGLAGEVSDQ